MKHGPHAGLPLVKPKYETLHFGPMRGFINPRNMHESSAKVAGTEPLISESASLPTTWITTGSGWSFRSGSGRRREEIVSNGV
jgi:hypothetical protein